MKKQIGKKRKKSVRSCGKISNSQRSVFLALATSTPPPLAIFRSAISLNPHYSGAGPKVTVHNFPHLDLSQSLSGIHCHPTSDMPPATVRAFTPSLKTYRVCACVCVWVWVWVCVTVCVCVCVCGWVLWVCVRACVLYVLWLHAFFAPPPPPHPPDRVYEALPHTVKMMVIIFVFILDVYVM